MTFSEKKANGVLILEVSGRIDTEHAEALLNQLNILIDGGDHHLLLDFSGVDYITSSGLRTLLITAKKLNGLGGKMVLATVTELVHEILRVSGCASLIGIYPSNEDALKALRG